MAISFPASPVNGQTHTENGQIFVFDSTRGYWLVKKQERIVASTSRSTFVATAGQTVHNVNYDPAAAVIVSVNGVMLNPQDVTATNGTSITFDTALSLSDEVDIVFHQPTASNLTRHSVSDTAPSGASSGDLWFNSANLKTYVYYDDGSSAQWVATNPLGADGADGAAGSSVTAYANLVAFPSLGNTEGDFAFAQDTKALYVWDGTEWDRISSGIDESPIILTEPPTTHVLNFDGTTSNVTMVAEDPEGFDISYGIVYKNTGNTRPSQLSANPTVDANGVYTFTPTTNQAAEGNFTARLSASDGIKTTTRLVDFTLAFPFTSDEVLIVAGGGSGGQGGGGGAGGLLYFGTNTTPKTPNGSAPEFRKYVPYTITVGDGGNINNFGPLGWGGEHGKNSSISGDGLTTSTYTAIGGGGGAAGNYTNGSNNNAGFIGGDGGSGGGGGGNYAGGGPLMPGGSGVSGQGYDGGAGSAVAGSPAAGGGGAGAVGGDHTTKVGGIGLEYDITGTATYYAGGGGGGSYSSGEGSGALGGGGSGFTHNTYNATTDDGTPNTGGGGGGGSGSNSNGGSGIVIIKIPNTITATGTGFTETTTGNSKVLSFTSSGSVTFG